jgi:hypothetical protein
LFDIGIDIDVDYGTLFFGSAAVINAEEDDWILAFNTTATDVGYTDAVVLVEDVSSFPEPSIIALLWLILWV